MADSLSSRAAVHVCLLELSHEGTRWLFIFPSVRCSYVTSGTDVYQFQSFPPDRRLLSARILFSRPDTLPDFDSGDARRLLQSFHRFRSNKFRTFHEFQFSSISVSAFSDFICKSYESFYQALPVPSMWYRLIRYMTRLIFFYRIFEWFSRSNSLYLSKILFLV